MYYFSSIYLSCMTLYSIFLHSSLLSDLIKIPFYGRRTKLENVFNWHGQLFSEIKFAHLSPTINASTTFSNGTTKGHILPFLLLMKCQAIDLSFFWDANLPPSLTSYHCWCDVSEPVEVVSQFERCRRGAGKGHQSWGTDGGRCHRWVADPKFRQQGLWPLHLSDTLSEVTPLSSHT